MTDLHKKPDVRDSSVHENDLYAVGPHRKVVSPNSLVAVLRSKELEQQYPTFLDLLDGVQGIANLKNMFNAIAAGVKENRARHGMTANSEIFWLVNATDDRVAVNHTYSQGSYPHAHIIHGPLPEGYKYEYILKEKTYTPSPRADFNEKLQSTLHRCDGTLPANRPNQAKFRVIIGDGKNSESPFLTSVTSPDFLNFLDFATRAKDVHYDILLSHLKTSLGRMVRNGGARLICNDFNSPGIFMLRIQGGDQKHKWFERPQPAL